jgi:aminopeptidase N
MKNNYVKQNKDLSKSASIKQFNLPGSEVHYSDIYPFKIQYMSLKINPDFSKMRLLDCHQYIKITSLRRISSIVLDIYELKISRVESSSHRVSKFSHLSKDKLVIEFLDMIEEGKVIDLSISYSAGYVQTLDGDKFVTPRNGFHFITKNNNDYLAAAYQAWTQGEATDARYWFPCVNSPQMKFTLEIEITTSNDHLAIANGLLESKKEENGKIIWKYSQKIPLAAYLVSVVIGKFTVIESKYNKVPLFYYWPEDTKNNDPMLTFAETPNMISFLENYFEIPYPFQKYAQTAVDNFEFGGMENASCTTITRNVFHNDSITVDYHNDILLIIHELAHQWFGNLVTCKDWPHLWLNEGFATYCELLYWEKSRGKDEFHFNLIKYADSYFEEADDEYIRPIVTNLYKHPDDLFDAHAYEKASIVIHMLRCHLGDETFRESIKKYLTDYQHESAETYDLLNKIEKVSGIQMHSFFDQWLFREGHPEITVEYELESASIYEGNNIRQKILFIKVIQKSEIKDNKIYRIPFKFPLEVLIKYVDEKGNKNQIIEVIQVDRDDIESKIPLPSDATITSISIDPNFKLLKKISKIKVLNETADFKLKDLLVSQMKNGETVIDRINAIRLLKGLYDEETVAALGEVIKNDSFYGVSLEAANTLGYYFDKNNYQKSNISYQKLLSILGNLTLFEKLHPEVKRAVVRNIGKFERGESIDLLEGLLKRLPLENVFVLSAVATALGKSGRSSAVKPPLKKEIISKLADLVNNSDTFQSVLSTGALDGIKEYSEEKDGEIYLQCIQVLLKSTQEHNDYFVISKATACLGKFLKSKLHQKDINVVSAQGKVLDKLIHLLRNERRRIKINACEALTDESAKFLEFPDNGAIDTIRALMEVARTDVDGFVRRKAEVCANTMKDWIADWAKKPLIIDSTEYSEKKLDI